MADSADRRRSHDLMFLSETCQTNSKHPACTVRFGVVQTCPGSLDVNLTKHEDRRARQSDLIPSPVATTQSLKFCEIYVAGPLFIRLGLRSKSGPFEGLKQQSVGRCLVGIVPTSTSHLAVNADMTKYVRSFCQRLCWCTDRQAVPTRIRRVKYRKSRTNASCI